MAKPRLVDNPPQEAPMDLCAGVLPAWAEQLRLAQGRSEKAVGEMMAAFAQVMQSGQPAQEQVEQMFRGFQYQDALNQMLELVIRDMQRMQQLLESSDPGEGPRATGAWMERLQSEFVMQEQRLQGLASPPAGGAVKAPDGPDDISFF